MGKTREVSIASIGARLADADTITNPTQRDKVLGLAQAEAALLQANALEQINERLGAFFHDTQQLIEAWATPVRTITPPDFDPEQSTSGAFGRLMHLPPIPTLLPYATVEQFAGGTLYADSDVDLAMRAVGMPDGWAEALRAALHRVADPEPPASDGVGLTATEQAAALLRLDVDDLANAIDWVGRINAERQERERADAQRAAIYDGDFEALQRHNVIGAPDPHNDPTEGWVNVDGVPSNMQGDPAAPNDPAGIVEGQSFDDGIDTQTDDDFDVVVPDAPPAGDDDDDAVFDPTVDDQELQALEDGDASIETGDYADVDADFGPSTSNPDDVFKEAKAVKAAKAQPKKPAGGKS